MGEIARFLGFDQMLRLTKTLEQKHPFDQVIVRKVGMWTLILWPLLSIGQLCVIDIWDLYDKACSKDMLWTLKWHVIYDEIGRGFEIMYSKMKYIVLSSIVSTTRGTLWHVYVMAWIVKTIFALTYYNFCISICQYCISFFVHPKIVYRGILNLKVTHAYNAWFHWKVHLLG